MGENEDMTTLVLIDDDSEVVELNKKYLEKAGYEVYGVKMAQRGIEIIKDVKPDCVILDIMMPDMNGFEACRKIREFSDVPIIFLTGRDLEEDRVKGLLLGGDDYLIKPYSLKELEVRIRVILRRVSRSDKELDDGQKKPVSGKVARDRRIDQNKLVKGKLVIDRIDHKVFFDGEEIVLTNREYDAFIFMAENPGRVITFKELGEKMFGSYLETDRQSIMVIMSRLRKKMKISYEFSNMIETVWSKGYKFLT